jgi:ribonuclease PH
MRNNKRAEDRLRPVNMTADYIESADGSVLIEMGRTRVLTTASVEDKVPPFLKGAGRGWVTAEYAMLPGSTDRRTPRERTPIRISGRTQEIQRLIGRSLRAATDLTGLGERTIIVDCDVLQADGGTRSAAITGGCVAMALAMTKMLEKGQIERMPLRHLVAAVSLGLVGGRRLLDLDYSEDSRAELDMNVVQTDTGSMVEVQASAERGTFARKDFDTLLDLAGGGIAKLIGLQKDLLKSKSLLFMAYNRANRS